MGELLALRNKSNIDRLKDSVKRPAPGVPLNALPGWSEVPLYSKLPMLNCPNSQIVFSRNKIGDSLVTFDTEYDPCCYGGDNAYNSLQDRHLKGFYSRQKNIDHLKKIGKITEDNYVICDLNDFNAYRKILNRAHLFAIKQELQKQDKEQYDKAVVAHAEMIAFNEEKQPEKLYIHDPIVIKKIKDNRLNTKHISFKENLEKIEKRLEKIENSRNMNKIDLKQKAYFRKLVIDQHISLADEKVHKKIMATKKQLKFREKRLKVHFKKLADQKKAAAIEMGNKQWQLRLVATKKRHERNLKLIAIAEEELKQKVEIRKLDNQKKWEKIKDNIAQKIVQRKSIKKSIIAKNLTVLQQLEKEFLNQNNKKLSVTSSEITLKSIKTPKQETGRDSQYFRKLSRKDLQDAIATAVDLQNWSVADFSTYQNISTYQTAKYILQRIVSKVQLDIANDDSIFKMVYSRLESDFKHIEEEAIKKVELVLQNYGAEGQGLKESTFMKAMSQLVHKKRATEKPNLSRTVSFGADLNTIPGQSAWQYDEDFSQTKIQSTKTRPPTPTGSLLSVAGVLDEEDDEDETDSFCLSRRSQNNLSSVKRDEKVFVIHLLVKFKHALVVGVGKKVFESISLHKQNNKMELSEKLLELDKHYLLTATANSILSYGKNIFNYDSNLLLCIGVLSSDIIFKLQNTVMKQKLDIRRPASRCLCKQHGINVAIGNLL